MYPRLRLILRFRPLHAGHDSGNILMFDPSLPHLKPVLCISFNQRPQVKTIALMKPFGLLAIARMDGTMHIINCFTPHSKIMNNALDPTKPVRSPSYVQQFRITGKQSNKCVFQHRERMQENIVVGRYTTVSARARCFKYILWKKCWK